MICIVCRKMKLQRALLLNSMKEVLSVSSVLRVLENPLSFCANLLGEVTTVITVNGYDLTEKSTNVDHVRENVRNGLPTLQSLSSTCRSRENITFAPIEHKRIDQGWRSWIRDGIAGKKSALRTKLMPIQIAFRWSEAACSYCSWTCHESWYHALWWANFCSRPWNGGDVLNVMKIGRTNLWPWSS